MTNSNIKTLKNKTLNKIRFLEDQLVALDHYLPTTYDFLLTEIDYQKRTLAELEVGEYFLSIEQDEPTST
jgi:hypothetical protein